MCLAERKLVQGTWIIAISAWGRKLWMPVPRTREEKFIKYLVEKVMKTKSML